MRAIGLAVLSMAASGCPTPTDPTDEPTSAPTDDPTDLSKTSVTADTATTEDTGPPPGPTDVTLDITGDWKGLGAAVIPIEEPAGTAFKWIFGEVIASVGVQDATPLLTLESPLSSELSPSSFANVRWGTYLVAVSSPAQRRR